jgi:D-alanyl-D-alanine carboxypeptidase
MAALMPPPQPSPQPNIQPNIQPDPQISAPQPAPDTAPARSAPIYDDQTILQVASATMPSPSIAQGEVVTRLSTSGGKHWGVNVGRFKSSDAAERVLVKMQLVESAVLGEGLRNVTQKGGGFDANFFGLSQEAAELACRRLTARAITCIPLGP